MTDASLTFRRYLLRPAVLAMVLALWAALFIVTWAMYQQFRGLLVEQGVQLTQQFAQRGITLLLVEDPALVKQTVEAFRDYPGVRYLAIRDRNGKLRVEEGVRRFDRDELPRSDSAARLLREDNDRWQFIAPIYTGSHPSPSVYSDDRQTVQVIGYALVDIDKASLRALVAALAPINIIVGVVLSLIVVAWAKNDALKLHTAYLEAEIALRLQEVIATRDRLLSQQERRAEFLATVTHEMRTPLTGILGNVQLALEEIEVYEEKPDPERLRVVLTSVQQLLALVNRMLEAQKLEAGRMEVNLEPVRLDTLVREAVSTVMPYLRANQNRMEQQIEAGEPLLMDREKLLQVLLNLLSNAGKYTQGGLVSLIVRQTPTELRIVVHDTGVGIPADEQTQIFEWYRKVDTSDARRYQGTGLGLAISKGFCELLGGSISVESKPQAGSTFTVVIPLPITASAPRDVPPPGSR